MRMYNTYNNCAATATRLGYERVCLCAFGEQVAQQQPAGMFQDRLTQASSAFKMTCAVIGPIQ